ncbi:hypothetical protein U1Q18_017071 [Sarracenia purpurea var. burkii]
MQASKERTLSPILSSDSQDGFAETCVKIDDEFSRKITLDGSHGDKSENPPPCDEEAGEDDEDFSFSVTGAGESPIHADDVFQNGQIKLSFPVFDQHLLIAGDSVLLEDDLRRRPAVNKVFFEIKESSPPKATEEAEGQAAGPFCAWSEKSVEASPEICKKSNSTGFSKLWRFRDLLNRSNSDGRDAFVFLDGSTTTSSKSDEKVDKSESKSVVFLNGSTATSSKSDEKVDKSESISEKKPAGDDNGNGAGKKLKAKKVVKGKTASLSAHELHYVRNRELREKDRRRSYLPYRPELFGFFTNVQGGLSRNVHPF